MASLHRLFGKLESKDLPCRAKNWTHAQTALELSSNQKSIGLSEDRECTPLETCLLSQFWTFGLHLQTSKYDCKSSENLFMVELVLAAM